MTEHMFDGTGARQLVLVDDAASPMVTKRFGRPRPRLQPLVKNLYRQLDLRRRRAQIAARKYVEPTARPLQGFDDLGEAGLQNLK